MSWYAYGLGDAPTKPEIDMAAKSAEPLERALEGLTTAYLHGTTAYLLRQKDDENAPLLRLPAELVIADRFATGGASNTACEYAGKEYLYVTAAEGQHALARAKAHAAEKLEPIKEATRSFAQQDPEGIRELYEEMHGFHSLLVNRMSMTDASLEVADLRDHIAEEYWDEDLARIFRETVANKIPTAFSIQNNIAVMLASQLQAYLEIVETAWSSMYAILRAGIYAFFDLAELSSPEITTTYGQLMGVVGPALKKAYEPLEVAVDVASGAAGVLESGSKTAAVSGSSPKALREHVYDRIREVHADAERLFDDLRDELLMLERELNGFSLHEITLPEIDSVF